MAYTSLEIYCGNGICQLNESAMSCPSDCVPKLNEYFNCLLPNTGCAVPGFSGDVRDLFIVIMVIVLLVYLKRSGYV